MLKLIWYNILMFLATIAFIPIAVVVSGILGVPLATVILGWIICLLFILACYIFN